MNTYRQAIRTSGEFTAQKRVWMHKLLRDWARKKLRGIKKISFNDEEWRNENRHPDDKYCAMVITVEAEGYNLEPLATFDLNKENNCSKEVVELDTGSTRPAN